MATSPASTRSAERPDPTSGWEALTSIAFVLAMGLAMGRGMLLEVIREAFDVAPGQDIVLRSPGAATTAVLNLLCFLPAMLVAARATFDDRFRLRWSTAALMLAAIGTLAVASIFWSVDRFAAAASAGKLLAGAAILWTLIQTVRDWGRFRVVCGVLVGVLAVNIAHGLIYVNYDLPEMKAQWQQTSVQSLKERGIEPGSFQAIQFEKRVMAGELMGFCASPNSLAALMAMISMLLVGHAAAKWQSRQYAMLAAPAVLMVFTGWAIWKTDSMTAYVTPVLGIALIAAGWRWRTTLAAWRRALFCGGIGLFVAAWAAIIVHGLHHGTLFHRSITFRWHYWVASFELFKDHLWRGVGWENFSAYYLQYRLPIAPEEIRDPHNLFVRFATELGLLGLVLACGWIAAIFWETTRPMALSQGVEKSDTSPGIRPLVAVVAMSAAVAILAQVDFRQDAAVVLLEAMRWAVYAVVMLGAAALFCARDFKELRVDNSAAPVLLLSALAGLSLFLIHSQIDFALFETGPFFAFVVMTGALIGARGESGPGTGSARIGLLAGAVWAGLFVATGIVVTAPIVMAEGNSRQADEAIAGKRFAEAKSSLQLAYDNSAWLRNADYLLRKGRAQSWAGEPAARIVPTITLATAANPRQISARLTLADLLSQSGDHKGARSEYLHALELNPSDTGIRLEVAQAMEQMHLPDEALRQYLKALELNALLPKNEAERLSESRVEDIRTRIAKMQPR